MSARYRVIVPVQAPSRALPRSGLAGDVRAKLHKAFAKDTLAVVRRCRSVLELVVVSPDETMAELAAGAEAGFVLSSYGVGLNAAVDEAHRQTHRAGDQMVAALVSDLPALQSDELEHVLAAAGRGNRTFHVTDLGHANLTLQMERATTFTACLASDPTKRRVPRGEPLMALMPGLRGDVDTCAGLRVAAYMGVGPATRQVMDELANQILARGEAI